MEVQKIKISEMPGQRVETGAVEFTYPGQEKYPDWPGYFIRGDNAFHIAIEIKALEDSLIGLLENEAISDETRNTIRWHLRTLVGLKDDIVGNTIVRGPEQIPGLLSKGNNENDRNSGNDDSEWKDDQTT